MAEPPGPKPYAARWRPVADLPPEAESWGVPGYREFVEQWREARQALEDRRVNRYLMDIWLRQRSRSFAIETGQIEGLYRLRRGITEQLVVEGFEGVRGAHSVEPSLDDETLRGLLDDQEESIEIIFDMAKGGTPLGNSTIKGIHAVLTRHQRTAVGFDPIHRRRVPIALLRGEYKKWPNNPRRPDGVVHEYCPPEQVDSEMDRFLDFHRSHTDRDLPTEVEAAWLHHAFVRIHPFQDGNGRMSRLLVAYAYARRGEFPPIVLADEKEIYIGALEAADDGDLREFIGFLGRRSSTSTGDAVSLARQILAGRDHLRHRNGGVTANGKYYPPGPDPD